MIGVIGAGQLGRMLALAGYPLGQQCLFLDPASGAPASALAPQIVAPFTDAARLAQLAARTEVLTFDWENVSVESLRALGRGVRIRPPVAALAAAQDRVREKRLFEQLAIPTTRWQAVDSPRSLQRALRGIGLPAVLKTRRLGYDGKGQAVVRTAAEAMQALAGLGGVPLLYEELVPFDFEVSVIAARSTRGEVVVYPLNRNLHAGGILRLTRAPGGGPALQRQAARYVRRLLEHFRYAGVLTLEFFVRRGRLLANEMAPRVHNSGHWTIEGAVTSQFENHLRAILGLPLGAAAAVGHAAMINLLGRMPPRERVLAQAGVHLHDYGKQERPGRKLGHCTIVAATARDRDARVRALLAVVDPELKMR
ncbi:MAG TPA: 5-(carboxyamino)imidazole ribonucleotide synthase [Steroidobacteraceae bacterium]|nr:5-(carboxyamino)imidazole ribonucleotide synthase [Steroidobacteraceae bacterium]